MCVIVETTVTFSGGFPSLFSCLFHALVHLPEQPIRVISLSNELTLNLQVEPAKITQPLTAMTSPEPRQCVGALTGFLCGEYSFLPLSIYWCHLKTPLCKISVPKPGLDNFEKISNCDYLD